MIAGLANRLDRQTSGLMVLAKKASILVKLNQLFAEDKVFKNISVWWKVILVKRKFLKNYFLKRIQINLKRKFSFPKAGFKPIETTAVQLDYSDGLSLLDIELRTGRYHQIRATLSYLGHPMWNDLHYKAPKRIDDKRIALHAWQIEFPILNRMKRCNSDVCRFRNLHGLDSSRPCLHYRIQRAR